MHLEKEYEMVLALSGSELKEVRDVRSKTFGVEQNYCQADLDLDLRFNDYYILCRRNGKAIGTQTAQIGYLLGDISFEKYFNLDAFYRQYAQLIFCSRNAVLAKYRNSSAAMLLYLFILKLCDYTQCRYIVTDCKKNNAISCKILNSLGFEKIGECLKGAIGEVYVWGLYRDDSPYIKNPVKRRVLERIEKKATFPFFLGQPDNSLAMSSDCQVSV